MEYHCSDLNEFWKVVERYCLNMSREGTDYMTGENCEGGRCKITAESAILVLRDFTNFAPCVSLRF